MAQRHAAWPQDDTMMDLRNIAGAAATDPSGALSIGRGADRASGAGPRAMGWTSGRRVCGGGAHRE
jgi:hypothetical protein